MDITSVSWPALTAAAGTVTGNHYRENYDAHHLDPSLPLAVLADGMGDGPGSAFAGRTAVTRLTQNIREATTPHAPAALRAAVASIHEDVRDFARTHPGSAGCTLTALIPDADGGAWVIQIGDSRAYRLRNGLLELLTVDHTAAWLGAIHGWFAHDSPESRAARYRLTRYIGHPDAPDPDILNEALHPGDVYLLCTDGVADQLTYSQLNDTLQTAATPAAAVRTILTLTLTAGGADNATAIVLTVPPPTHR
jgi:serine/threonine protein phosphatase PrpC